MTLVPPSENDDEFFVLGTLEVARKPNGDAAVLECQKDGTWKEVKSEAPVQQRPTWTGRVPVPLIERALTRSPRHAPAPRRDGRAPPCSGCRVGQGIIQLVELRVDVDVPIGVHSRRAGPISSNSRMVRAPPAHPRCPCPTYTPRRAKAVTGVTADLMLPPAAPCCALVVPGSTHGPDGTGDAARATAACVPRTSRTTRGALGGSGGFGAA